VLRDSWNGPCTDATSVLSHPKKFRDPSGAARNRPITVDAIQSKCPYDLFRDEWIHRGEHSIEFQCVFLRFLIPPPTPIRIVPILAGSFHEAIEKGTSPQGSEPVRQFTDALRETLAPYGKKICFIASADLAHMGLQFGIREALESMISGFWPKKIERC